MNATVWFPAVPFSSSFVAVDAIASEAHPLRFGGRVATARRHGRDPLALADRVAVETRVAPLRSTVHAYDRTTATAREVLDA